MERVGKTLNLWKKYLPHWLHLKDFSPSVGCHIYLWHGNISFFSNSVQRSWLYPLLLTLQIRVASPRDSNPRLRWHCRYVAGPTCRLHVKTHTQFYIEEVVDLRVEESLSLSFHYSDCHSQKKTKSGSRSIFKTVTFKLKNFNMTECNILCIFYSFESNFI